VAKFFLLTLNEFVSFRRKGEYQGPENLRQDVSVMDPTLFLQPDPDPPLFRVLDLDPDAT
jgi:hypothetical protein